LIEIDGGHVETLKLSGPDPTRVEHLQDGQISRAQGRFTVGPFKQPENIVNLQIGGEIFFQLGRCNIGRRISPVQTLLFKEKKK